MPCHSPGIGNDESLLVKLTTDQPLPTLEKAARRLLEHAHAFEPIQDGRISIEKLNGPVPVRRQGHARGIQCRCLQLAIARGWLELHNSGTYVKFTAAGADLFA